MGISCKATAALALGTMLVAAVPAAARDGRWHRHRDRDHVSTGEAIGAVALIGLIAALAAKKPKPVAYESAPLPPAVEGGAPDADPREAAAVQACIDQVGEHYAGEEDRVGRVEQITDVTPRDSGGYKVHGLVRVESWNGQPIQVSRFKCSVGEGGNSRSLTIT